MPFAKLPSRQTAGHWGTGISGRMKQEIRESLRSTVDWRAVLRYSSARPSRRTRLEFVGTALPSTAARRPRCCIATGGPWLRL